MKLFEMLKHPAVFTREKFKTWKEKGIFSKIAGIGVPLGMLAYVVSGMFK